MSRTHRIVIGVMGADDAPRDVLKLAERAGRRVAEHRAVLLTGGRSGVMEAASKGAASNGGLVIGVLPGKDAAETPPNPFVHVALFTGLGDGRDYVNACGSDAIVAMPGAWGTLGEIAHAKKLGRPVILCGRDGPEGLPRAETPEEAVDMAYWAVRKGKGTTPNES
jgi:hypothetical protein